MTPTEQDKELLENIADIFDELCEPTNKFWHRDSGLHWAGKVMQLITADRKRVALEARIDELNRLMEYTDENEIVCVCEQASVQVCDHNWSLCHKARERIAELRQKVGRDDQPE